MHFLSTMKRLFIAFKIELNQENANLLQDLRRNTVYDSIVWVNENIQHCTLRFLGKTPENKIDTLKNIIQEVVTQHPSFALEIEKLGFFGSRYAPKVIWLGFRPQPLLQQLFEALEQRIVGELGMEKNDGHFVPHITLGRIKKVDNKRRFWATMEKFTPFYQKMEVKEIILYQSRLEKDGPIYLELAKYSLHE